MLENWLLEKTDFGGFLPSAEQGFRAAPTELCCTRHTLPFSGENKFVGVPTLLHWLKTAIENRFDGSPFNSFLLGSKGRALSWPTPRYNNATSVHIEATSTLLIFLGVFVEIPPLYLLLD